MRELISESFEEGRMPSGWFTDSLYCTFEQGCLIGGKSTNLLVPLPGHGWRRLRVEVEVQPVNGAHVRCGWDGGFGLGVLSLKVALTGSAYARHVACKYQTELASNVQPIGQKDGFHTVTFDFAGGNMAAAVDGYEVTAAVDPYPRQLAGRLMLQFFDDCLIRRIRVLGEEPLDKPLYQIPARHGDDFFLEVNVDFADDLIKAPFTRKMFDDLFAEFKSWGVRRVHWIYYGKQEDGWWDFGPAGIGENAAKTFENVGDIFSAAVKAAHNHGLEIFGLIKPFDMGLRVSYGEGTPEAGTEGRIQRVGGPVGWIAKFAAERRDLVMARRPGTYGEALNDVFTRIDLVKEDDRACALSVNDIHLYVSDDNATYRAYDGPIAGEEVVEDYPVYVHTPSGAKASAKTRRSRVLRLDGLSIRNKYVALQTSSSKASFSNSLVNLIHVFGEKGEESRLTYGATPRDSESDLPLSFRDGGVEYDSYPDVPTAVFGGGYDAIRSTFTLDSGEAFLAIARGKDSGPLAALSPSFPETRQWWLSWVRDVLDAGADGVELRVRNHHSDFAWGEYGFEAPVVESFKKRYGVDLLTTDDFDRATFRTLRGEAYTQFYREAKQVANSYGKPLGLHISITMDTEPEQGAAMEIHWDWRTWLMEGLADSITMKEVWPGSRFAQEILSYARPRGIPVVFCPYANHYWNNLPPYTSPSGSEKVIDGYIQMAREGGYDGYQFYECASVIDGTLDGNIIMREPALRELLQRHFGAR